MIAFSSPVRSEAEHAERWDLPDVLLVPLDSLTAYFTRIQAIPLLTAAEERDLGRAMQAGDPDAALRLAQHNLRYAAHCARKWERAAGGEAFPGSAQAELVWSLGDAVQAANLGLWAAVQRYDPAIARFTTYATWWIRQAWDRARNDFIWQIRLPAHAVEEWRAYQRTAAAWTQSHGEEPTADDLHSLLGWPRSRIAFWQRWASTTAHPLSLDAPLTEDGSAWDTVLSAPADLSLWDRFEYQARRTAVDALLTHLTAREADVLRLRFGLSGAPMTLQEVGNVLRVTRERIRQIEAKALQKLREWIARHPEEHWRDWLTP